MGGIVELAKDYGKTLRKDVRGQERKCADVAEKMLAESARLVEEAYSGEVLTRFDELDDLMQRMVKNCRRRQ